MTIRRIAVIGATGMLGRPVAQELASAGYEVTKISRSGVVRADIFDPQSIGRAIQGHDAVYLNLAIKPGERPDEPHTETDGLRNVIAAARETGVQRIAMISSLVQNYQGMNGFHWWAFDVKHRAVQMLRESPVPTTIFYPSSFMENLPQQQQRGERIMLAGTSHFPMWFIAGRDYGRQVARSFAMPGQEFREYPVQGLEPFRYDEAARVYADNHPHARLKVMTVPLAMLKALGIFSRSMRNASKILEALNHYPERFQSETTWAELGKPQVTLAEFARMT